jgi:saccharopepsin
MVFAPALLALASVAAGAVHKLPLKHIPRPADADFRAEAQSLAHKYGGQTPLGREPQLRFARPAEDDLYRTQEQLKGGHSVPLSSTSFTLQPLSHDRLTNPRL